MRKPNTDRAARDREAAKTNTKNMKRWDVQRRVNVETNFTQPVLNDLSAQLLEAIIR